MKIVLAVSAMCSLVIVNGTDISVEGSEGGEVSFQCSHLFAQNNVKYFCKDPCENEHVLGSVKPGTVTLSGKISLWDTRDGTFRVTLSNLSIHDTGTYWCGAKRFPIDTYTRVVLRVSKVKPDMNSHPHKTTTTSASYSEVGAEVTTAVFMSSCTQTQVTNSTVEAFQTHSTNASQDHQEHRTTTSYVVYLIVGVVVVLTVFVVLSLSLRKCKEKSRSQVQVCSKPLQLISNNQNQVHVQNYCMTDNLKYGPAGVLQDIRNQPVYVNLSYSQQLTENTKGATISRGNHFPSYVYPLPALPEQDNVKKAGAEAETHTEQASLWFGLVCPQT